MSNATSRVSGACAPSRRARARNRDERKARRERQFAAYFAGAKPRDLAWDDIGLEQTPWLSGEPAPGHIVAYVEELVAGEVLHAERVESGIFAIVRGLPGAAHRNVEGGEMSIRAIDASLLDNLLVGVKDGSGRTLAMGIITRVDYKNRRITVVSPLPDHAPVRALRLGAMRVSPDGAELGHGGIA